MWYKVFGVFRCPYREKCGPDKSRIPWADDYEKAIRGCYTIRHYRCPVYSWRNREESPSKARRLINKIGFFLAFEPRFEMSLKRVK